MNIFTKFYLLQCSKLNNNFLICTKAEIYDLIVCIVVSGEKFKISKSCCELDLDQTMTNIELIHIFLYIIIII